MAVLYRRLFYCNGDGCFPLDLRGFILYVRVATRYLLEQWRSLERKPFVEPVCSPDFGRYIVYDVGGGRVEIFLGIQEGTGIGDLRRPRHNPVDDTFADHDGRFALAVGVIILIVMVLLIIGWRKMGSYDMRQDWKAILFYAVFTCGITQVVYLVSKYFYGEDASIHIEVLLPAFVLGMVMRHKHIDTKVEHNVATLSHSSLCSW